MLRSMSDIQGYRALAIDQDVGRIEDFYFDDQAWMTRYLVVDLELWMPGRRVLISPIQVGDPDWKNRVIPVSMTSEQIEQSPGIKEDLPVSMQEKINAEKDTVWAPFWPPVGSSLGGIPLQPQTNRDTAGMALEEKGDPRLRSVRELTNYSIETRNGSGGYVEDFITQTEDWAIRYMAVNAGDWLSGKKVLIPPGWIESIEWGEKRIHVDLERDHLKEGPDYDPSMPVNREYETRVYDFYGRPKYWEGESS